MRFLFVDSISSFSKNWIKGQLNLCSEHPLRHEQIGQQDLVVPGVVSEAIGQLASWLSQYNNEFTRKPVFLFAERIDVAAQTPTGSTLSLEAELEHQDEQTLRFSGRAKIEDTVVVSISSCSGYFMDLSELEDPDQVKNRWERLVAEKFSGYSYHDQPSFRFDPFIKSLETNGSTSTASLTFPRDAPFYADHFPRFPVTPIVMINEAIGAAARRALSSEGSPLVVKSINSLKIKRFIQPGDSCELKLQVIETMAEPASNRTAMRCLITLSKDSRLLLRGYYTFEFASKRKDCHEN